MPTAAPLSRAFYGTVAAIERLVTDGDVQTGFKALLKLGMRDWTIEAAVLKFPDRFSKSAVECAEFRLRVAQDGSL